LFYLPSGKRGTVHACGNPNAHTDTDTMRGEMFTNTKASLHSASPSNASAAPIVRVPSSKPTFNGHLTSAARYVMPHGHMMPIPRDYRS